MPDPAAHGSPEGRFVSGSGDVAVIPLHGPRAVLHHWRILLQLVLVLMVVHVYQIEGDSFRRLTLFAAGGFVGSLLLPVTWRLSYFALLSMAGVLLILGPVDGAWLLTIGMAIIGICHLPAPMPSRVVLMLLVAAAFAFIRSGIVESPWPTTIWPILGSMFMFRLILYMRALGNGQATPSWWGALSYFFMLPNVAFPLFPVVDYQTFRRTHFDRSEDHIYEQGMLWIARGLMHLVLYRFVYHNLLDDPGNVRDLSGVVQYVLATVLLYLRVSGQFHLIVGLLHLFGFRLPETHKLYYLSHSFTELWRRMNIYWTDFMMKVVFYPLYFRLKKLGPRAALAIATAIVFLTTWFLHSYQWFWLRGGFPITAPDLLFWGVLGSMVVFGALRDLKAPRARRSRGWSGRLGLQAGITFLIFCFLWSLWSSTSLMQWLLMLGAAVNVDFGGVAMLGGVFALIVVLGGRDWESPGGTSSAWGRLLAAPRVRTVTTLSLLLLLPVANKLVSHRPQGRSAAVLASLLNTGLNAQDAARKHRGYYEELDVREQPAALADAGAGEQQGWQTASEVGVVRERNGLLSRDLYPSRHVMWNGKPFTTNSWGMRDGDYSLAKPPGTLRIALLGPSHVMGNGVADGETFEAVLERRLNSQYHNPNFKHVEILNFGVDGHAMPEQLAMLSDRVLRFAPDVVIFTHHQREEAMTERYILKTVWNNVLIVDKGFADLLRDAGLAHVDHGAVPVPFEAGRRLARRLGLDPRMPQEESELRARRIVASFNRLSIKRMAEVTRENGARPIILGLNAVIDNAGTSAPHEDLIRQAGMPLLNLYDVFPEERLEELRAAPWDEHPNAAGHQLIADRLYADIVPILDGWFPSHPGDNGLSRVNAPGVSLQIPHTGQK